MQCVVEAVRRLLRLRTLARMRISSNVVGGLCLVVGCVWFLQGINILPGSFMTGQTKWAVYGAVLVIVGIVLLIRANRRRV